MVAPIAASTLVAAQARWCVAPVPKVASTLLKRLAVLADGREPASATAFGETRPVLAIHRAEIHGLPCLADLPQEQQDHWLGDAQKLWRRRSADARGDPRGRCVRAAGRPVELSGVCGLM